MRQVILNPVKVKTWIEQSDEQTNHEQDSLVEKEQSTDMLADDWDELYNKPTENKRSNIDRFHQYIFSSNCYKQKEQVKISKEEGFVVAKNLDKKSNITDLDNLYKIDKRLRHRKSSKRLGYIRGADRFRYASYNLDTTKEIVGIVNNQFPIRKHKGFSQKRVGYIKISDDSLSDSEDLYAEVTCNRDILQIIFTILLILTILLLPKAYNWDGHIDLDTSLIPSISELKSIFNQEQLILHHKEDASLNIDTNRLDLEIVSDPAENIEFQLRIYIDTENEKQLVYESERLKAGATLDQIELAKIESLNSGSYQCTITCEVYRSLPFELKPHIGTLESKFTLWI